MMGILLLFVSLCQWFLSRIGLFCDDSQPWTFRHGAAKKPKPAKFAHQSVKAKSRGSWFQLSIHQCPLDMVWWSGVSTSNLKYWEWLCHKCGHDIVPVVMETFTPILLYLMNIKCRTTCFFFPCYLTVDGWNWNQLTPPSSCTDGRPRCRGAEAAAFEELGRGRAKDGQNTMDLVICGYVRIWMDIIG